MGRARYWGWKQQRRRGFTLLELLLVVFILSVLALSAFSLSDTLDSSQDQFRYEAARNQAERFERAIVDRLEGQAVVGGFVADMGGLPLNMLELAFGLKDGTSAVSQFAPLDMRAAMFDPVPDAATLYNDGGEVTLLGLAVAKGFRGSLTTNGSTSFYVGAYLDLLPGSVVDYRTGGKSRFDNAWGATSSNGFLTIAGSTITRSASDHIVVDDLTHGWAMDVLTSTDAFHNAAAGQGAGEIYLKSVGRDNQLDASPPGPSDPFDYAHDVPMIGKVQTSDWATDALDIHVDVVNDLPEGSGVQDVALDGTQYGVRLLACNAKVATVSPSSPPLWRQFYSVSFSGVPSSGSRSVALLNPAAGITRLVPAGKHVLVLTRTTAASDFVDTPLARVIEVADGNMTATTHEQQRIYIPLLTGRNMRLAVDSDDSSVTGYAVSAYHSLTPTDLDTAGELTTLAGNLETELEATIDAESSVTGTNVVVVASVVSGQLVLDVTYQLPAGTSQYANLPRTQVQFDAPGVGDGFQYRGQVVTVLPGQANVIRLYLSSLFTQ